jgi:K+/H+ antiporter YhaU regulatory subunit KhtT
LSANNRRRNKKTPTEKYKNNLNSACALKKKQYNGNENRERCIMEKKLKITNPLYQQIATDIASKIADKHYQAGEKIYARSSLSSQYGVSAETARRAISILADLGIVDTAKGSGVIIKSYENAVKFLRHYEDIQTVNNLRQKITDSIEKQAQEASFLQECIVKLIDKTERFRHINPLSPFEIEITSATPHLTKTASEVNFWHNTSATIIAIKRNNAILISPGPYATFLEKDVVYFIGDENCLERVRRFMYPH